MYKRWLNCRQSLVVDPQPKTATVPSAVALVNVYRTTRNYVPENDNLQDEIIDL
jgi:hypothetical protein